MVLSFYVVRAACFAADEGVFYSTLVITGYSIAVVSDSSKNKIYLSFMYNIYMNLKSHLLHEIVFEH